MHVDLDDARAVCERAPSIGAPIAGTVADHVAVASFLNAVFQKPSPEEFASSVDDPFYDPADRILLKHGGTILAHAQLTWRSLHFGKSRWPLCRLNWLGVLPEYHEQGLAKTVMDEAELQLRQLRPAIVELGCKQSPTIQRPGWVAVGRYVFSQAGPRDVIARLSEEDYPSSTSLMPKKAKVTARVWRRFELPSLMRIYRDNVGGTHGPLQRTEAYWRWLLARRAYDQIYIAVEEKRGSGGKCQERIVGYAVTRNGQIVELLTEAGNHEAARQLLVHACRDAIESDFHVIRLHGPDTSPLHQVFIDAGGSFHAREPLRGETMLVWLPDIDRHIDRVGPELAARARAAGIPLPCKLGVEVGDLKQQLVVRSRKAHLSTGQLGRSYIHCDEGTWIRLLTGHDNAATAMAEGRLSASTSMAAELARVLWPALSVWRPLWDDLSA